MPIGTSKLGVLGAGVVPGGTQTFNAPGTFSVPPGVSRVNITGRGGTGNPGNAGNAGNPGNPGTGGAGGAGVGSTYTKNPGAPTQSNPARDGGFAFKTLNGGLNPSVLSPQPTFVVLGGVGANNGAAGNAGQSGISGNAGSAGTAGNPGNAGNSSSGLCKTFPGGAGGNAGVAGNAGNAGGAGGGGGASSATRSGCNGIPSSGGSGGCSAGNGGPGTVFPVVCGVTPPQDIATGGVGGGGAGVTNSGQSGSAGAGLNRTNQSTPFQNTYAYALGGNWACSSAPFGIPGCRDTDVASRMPRNVTGGMGGRNRNPLFNFCGAGPSLNVVNVYNPANNYSRSSINDFNPVQGQPMACAPLRNELLRSGGGGAGGTDGCSIGQSGQQFSGGGGGGGGRGGAGGAGGNSSAPSGSAGTPQTFNCVPVTPGSPYPITVGGPAGGQIVISWNPQ